MKQVQIHCIDAKGEKFIMNRFSGENAGLSNPKNGTNRQALIERATHMAGEWAKVYPHDKFVVVEV